MKKYTAQFSFGEVKRGTENRTYAAAWAVFARPDSAKPMTGFSGSHQLAQAQVGRARANGYTGPAEIVPAVEVPK